MDNVLNYIMIVWKYFLDNILTQPNFLIGFIVLIGYLLLRKPIYEVIAGFFKATVGFMILQAGSGGLVATSKDIIYAIKDRFQMSAIIIDPYNGQLAVESGVEKVFNQTFTAVVYLLLFAFIFNMILVRLRKYTKLRAVFTTGNVQIQQAATGFWLILWAVPSLNGSVMLLVMSLLLGLYWAVGSNLTVDITQELTDGAGFAIAHQQMFGVAIFAKLAEKFKSSNAKRLEDIELPGFLNIFQENMVSTSILMFFFFGIIILALGRDYLIAHKMLGANASFFFYILKTALNFAVYLAILQLGVRTFVGELTQSFQGISNTLLPGAVPGIDVAATFGFGSANAVTIGFLFGALGQFVAIGLLLLMKSPVLIIAGFIPMFFDNAVIGVFANNRGGSKAAMLFPFISGLCQVFGSAFIAGAVGLAHYGGYLGMFDWAVIWPGFTYIMHFLGYAGIAVVAIILLAIPQLQYRANPEGYFLITEDYEAYKELMSKKA